MYFYKDNKEYKIEGLPFLTSIYEIIDVHYLDNQILVKVLVYEQEKLYVVDLKTKTFVEIKPDVLIKSKEFLPISKFAKLTGLTRQAIYNRLDKDLQEYLLIVNNKKMLNTKALELFKK